MSVKMIGGGQLAKLPISDAGAEADGGDGSAKFGELLSSLAVGKKTASAGDGLPRGKGQAEAQVQGKGAILGTLAALPAVSKKSDGLPTEGLETFLKSVLENSSDEAVVAATATVDGAESGKAVNLQSVIAAVLANLQAGTGQPGPDGAPATEQQAVELKRLAELIVKSTQQQGQPAKAVLPTTDDSIPMPGIKQVLNTWAQGPHAAAAMSTGAQEKAPMGLQVTDVATHFAPVAAAGLDVPDELRRDAKALASLVQELRRDTVDVAGPAGGMKANVEAGLSGQGGAALSNGDKKPPSPAPVAVLTGTEEAKTVAKPDLAMQDQSILSPAKQIANSVVREVKGLPQPPQVTQVPVDVRQPLGKLKVLQIQLQPESLGSVTVKMELRGDMIELRIDVMRAQTAELIQKDREILSSILRAAGYTADDAHIRVSHADSSMSMNSGQNGAGASNQSQSQTAQQDNQPGSQPRSNRAEEDDKSAAEAAEASVPKAGQRDDASGIYI